MKIALISASWHEDLVGGARTSCITELGNPLVDPAIAIDQFTVPGSLEIPLLSLKLAQSGKYAVSSPSDSSWTVASTGTNLSRAR